MECKCKVNCSRTKDELIYIKDKLEFCLKSGGVTNEVAKMLIRRIENLKLER